MFKSASQTANKWLDNRLDVDRSSLCLNDLHKEQIKLEITHCMVLENDGI